MHWFDQGGSQERHERIRKEVEDEYVKKEDVKAQLEAANANANNSFNSASEDKQVLLRRIHEFEQKNLQLKVKALRFTQ